MNSYADDREEFGHLDDAEHLAALDILRQEQEGFTGEPLNWSKIRAGFDAFNAKNPQPTGDDWETFRASCKLGAVKAENRTRGLVFEALDGVRVSNEERASLWRLGKDISPEQAAHLRALFVRLRLAVADAYAAGKEAERERLNERNAAMSKARTARERERWAEPLFAYTWKLRDKMGSRRTELEYEGREADALRVNAFRWAMWGVIDHGITGVRALNFRALVAEMSDELRELIGFADEFREALEIAERDIAEYEEMRARDAEREAEEG